MRKRERWSVGRRPQAQRGSSFRPVFPTRRVRWIVERELGAVGVRVMVDALIPREYAITDWWRHEEGLTAFQNEVIKYLFYRIKY